MAANPQDATFQRGTGGQRRPPRVTFKRRSKFDQRLTERNGRSSYVDEDVAEITSPDNSVVITKRVDEWFAEIDKDFVNYGMWAPTYKQMYRDWKEAHSGTAVDGTHISNWPLLSPAQVENFLAMGVKTIEQIAAMADEVAATVDGGAYIRSKARYWINASADIGTVAAESAGLKADNETLRAAIAHKDDQIAELKSEVKRLTDFFTGKEGFDVISGRVQPTGLNSVHAAGPRAGAVQPGPDQFPLRSEAPVMAVEKVVLSYESAQTLSMAELREYCYERNIKPAADVTQTLTTLVAAGEVLKPKGESIEDSEPKGRAKRK